MSTQTVETKNLIRFDRLKAPLEFNPEDWELTVPSEFDAGSFKSITSRIKYKGEDCYVRMPKCMGYGISKNAKDKDSVPKPDAKYSYSYMRYTDTLEQTLANKWIEECFEPWLVKSIDKVLKEQLELGQRGMSVVVDETTCQEIIGNPKKVKHFYFHTKDEKTKKIDLKSRKRNYVSILPKCIDPKKKIYIPDIEVRAMNGAEISYKNILNVGKSQKNIGDYIPIIKMKSVFFGGGQGGYKAYLQTTCRNMYYGKRADPVIMNSDMLGNDYNPNVTAEETATSQPTVARTGEPPFGSDVTDDDEDVGNVTDDEEDDDEEEDETATQVIANTLKMKKINLK